MDSLAPVIKILSCTDPALDAERMQAKPEDGTPSLASLYVVERDPKHVMLREGEVPTWYLVRRLPLVFLTDVLDVLPTRAAQRRMAFRAACHSIESTEPMSCSAPGEKGEHVSATTQHGVALAPESWVQAVVDRFGADVVMEIGECAITASRLRRGARGPFGWWGGSAASP